MTWAMVSASATLVPAVAESVFDELREMGFWPRLRFDESVYVCGRQMRSEKELTARTPTERAGPEGTGADDRESMLAVEAEALSLLHEAGSRLWRSRDLADGLQEALHAAIGLMAADMGTIELFDSERQVFVLSAQSGFETEIPGPFDEVSAVDGSPRSHALHSGERVVISDILTDAEFGPESLEVIHTADGAPCCRGVQFTPLVGRYGRPLGVISTYFRGVHHPTKAKLGLLDLFARQTGDFIERFQIEEALRQSELRERARAAELDAIMQIAPAAIWVARDPDCSVITGNRLSHEFLEIPFEANGAEPASEANRTTDFVIYSDGRALAADELPVLLAARGSTVTNFEEEIRFSDGRSRHLLGNAVPLRNVAGDVNGAVAAFIDITERKHYERDQQRLAAIVESCEDAIVSKDLEGVITSWNKSAERLFGFSAAEAIGRPITIIIPPERLHEEPEILGRIKSDERIEHFETVRLRKDGTPIEISLTASPIKNAGGQIIGASKIARDISDRKHSEAQRDLLIAELNHRVKNTLATVISIARQSFSSTHQDLSEALNAFDTRIRALAQTHGRLAETRWAGVTLDMLLQDEFARYLRNRAQIRLDGPMITLKPKSTLALGMAVHELAANAVKFGALSLKSGMVEVNWALAPADNQLRLHWKESGGPRVSVPTHSGFGLLFLERALALDVTGTVEMDFAPEGVCCTIAIPRTEFVVGRL
jgi:PAS domain S-box-containing protein